MCARRDISTGHSSRDESELSASCLDLLMIKIQTSVSFRQLCMIVPGNHAQLPKAYVCSNDKSAERQRKICGVSNRFPLEDRRRQDSCRRKRCQSVPPAPVLVRARRAGGETTLHSGV